MSLEDRQIALEQEMHEQGVARYRAQAARALQDGRATSAGPARWLLRNALQATEDAIVAWKRGETNRRAGRHSSVYSLIAKVDPGVLGFLTAQTVLDTLTNTKYQQGKGLMPFNSLAFRVAGAVLRDIRWHDYKTQHPNAFKLFKEKIRGRGTSHRDSFFGRVVRDRGVEVTDWTKAQRLRVGTVLLELFIDSTGLVDKHAVKLRRAGHFRYEVGLTERTVAWIEDSHQYHEAMAPVYMPMLVPPLDWYTGEDGGYLTNLVMREPLMSKRKNQASASELSAEVRACVNHLQATPWQINPDLYEVVCHFWDNGVGIADLAPAENVEIPQLPDDEGTEEQRRDYARKCAEVHKMNLSRRASRIRTVRTLDLAKRFRDETFYFPMKLDFRGRAYPLPSFLSPQGAGLARGLLRFAEGHTVELGSEAAGWLAVHGANCWGEDKVDLEARVDWVHDREAEIRAVYEDPVTCLWWTEADKPWEFLAWCLEWGQLQEEGTVESHIPVAMDGSNNGLQIFSLLLRDEGGAEATNVLPGEAPQDVYQRVADRAWDEVSEHSNEEMADPWIQWLESGPLPRAATKRPVMVLPYGGTPHSCREYVREWVRGRALEHPHGWDTSQLFRLTNWLGDIIWEAIGATVPAAIRGMAWLHEAANITMEHGISLEWTTPTGFIVRQSYQQMKNTAIKTTVGDKIIRGTYQTIDMTKLDKRKQRNGVAPNFVHSLDAACMARTVAFCRTAAIGSLSMIHDSFACHAVDAALLARLLREAYVSVFQPDQLALFRDQVQAQLPEGAELPPLPDYGELNPDALLGSTYFFA